MYEVTVYNGDKETVIHRADTSGVKLASGVIKEEVNLIDSFDFSVHMNNPGYGKLKPLSTQITVLDMQTNEYVFEGRVLFPTDTMASSGLHSTAFICEAELGFLNDSTQTHGEYHDITVRDFLQVIVDNHNADVADDPIDKTFEVGIVDVDSSTGTLYRYLGYEKTFEAIKDKLLDRLGGELRVRKENGVRYLDYVQAIGELEETEIKLAKNLQSITKEVDPTEMITRLVPLGARIESEDPEATDASQARVTIESVNGGKDYLVDEAAEKALGTIVVGSVVFDGVNEPGILKTRGLQHLQAHNRLKIQHSVSALDLSIIGKTPGKFRVGSWYPTFNPVMGIDEPLRVIAKTTDILEPWNNGLTIGDKMKTASQYQAEANKGARMAKELESRVVQLSEVNRGLSRSLTKTRDDLQDLVRKVEENPVEELKIPAYYRDHVNDKINTVNNLQSVDGFNRFSFGFITDMHIQTNQRHSAVMMREFVNRTNLSVVINGGDQISNSGSTTKSTAIGWIRELMDMVTPIKSLMMNTMGNHDDNSITKQWDHTLKEPEIYSELFRYMGNRSVSGANGKYHYRDDFFNKVRYIVLDSHDVPYIQEGNGLKYTGQWDYVFRQEQLDWFANVALDTPDSDWSVVVASHVPVYDDGIMTGFDYPVANADLARGILKAYKEKTTYANSSASEVVADFQADVSVDFTGKGGDVIVWLAGHTHYDNVVQMPEGIPMVTTLCDSSLQWSDAPSREIGTINEHAFDVITVDKANRQIYMTRVGAGESRQVGY